MCQQLSQCIEGTRTLYGQSIQSAQELFSAIDTSNSSFISSQELLAAVQRLDLGLHPHQVEAFYRYLGGESQHISVSILADAIVHHHRTRMLSEENTVLKEYTTILERQRSQVIEALACSCDQSIGFM